MSTTSINLAPTPKCTLSAVWTGFKDWYLERCYGPSKGSQPTPRSGPRPASVLWLILVIPAGIAALAVLAPILAPALVTGMSMAGDAAVANTAMGAGMLLGLGFVVGVPVLLLTRFARFIKTCCVRGQELQDGSRNPVCRT